MVTMAWKVYGRDGHRQRASFGKSFVWDFSTEENPRIIEVENSDKTGTNEYCVVRITRNTEDECRRELDGQISDGLFEDSRVGDVVELEG